VVLKIMRQGGHLLLQENQEAPGELFPEAELRFFSKTSVNMERPVADS
jgi:hypothetical protein